MMPLVPDTPLHGMAAAIQSGDVSVQEVVEAALHRIETLDAGLNAFTLVMDDSARLAASHADTEIAAGRYRGPLHGIPISIKDLIDVAGVPTTAASQVTDRSPAGVDAPVVARLRDAGAILIGK
ncbi:MAG: amidase family protein, partial [bacterium]